MRQQRPMHDTRGILVLPQAVANSAIHPRAAASARCSGPAPRVTPSMRITSRIPPTGSIIIDPDIQPSEQCGSGDDLTWQGARTRTCLRRSSRSGRCRVCPSADTTGADTAGDGMGRSCVPATPPGPSGESGRSGRSGRSGGLTAGIPDTRRLPRSARSPAPTRRQRAPPRTTEHRSCAPCHRRSRPPPLSTEGTAGAG